MEHQLDIFEDNVVRARKRDPETSHEAAAAFAAKEGKVQRSVQAAVAILRAHGPLTDFQISAHWAEVWPEPFSESLPRKARHWARQAGLVEHEGYGMHQKRRVRTWTIT